MKTDAARDVWQLSDLSIAWSLRVVSTLAIADLITDGTYDVTELALATGTDAGALARVLRNCAAHNVFRETESGVFELTERAETLVTGHPSRMSMWLRTDNVANRMDRTFADLMHSVTTGRAAYDTAHGVSFYDDLTANPDLQKSFDTLMAADVTDHSDLAKHLDAENATVVDVGGGHGELLADLLAAVPTMRGGLLELPGTAEVAARRLGPFGERVEVVTGSFLDKVAPTGADIYLTCSVLHNWCDDDVVRIMKNIVNAARPDSRVVVVENVARSQDDLAWSSHLDLKMLVVLGGRERTVDEFTELAGQAGLDLVSSKVIERGPFALASAVMTFARQQ